MAIVALNATQVIDDVGTLSAAYQAGLTTTDTFTFPNDGRTFLHIKKSGAGSCLVSVTVGAKFKGKTVAAQTVTVPASTGDKMIGPFPVDLYNDPLTQLVSITFGEITGLTAAVLRLPVPT